jgi:hypothetical protein
MVAPENRDLPWRWDVASQRADVTAAIVAEHSELEWDWEALSVHRNITVSFMAAHAALPWAWELVEHKYGVAWDTHKHMYELPHFAATFALMAPEVIFCVHDKILSAYARRHMAAWKIQQKWLHAFYDPDHVVCQRRLSREFAATEPRVCGPLQVSKSQ